MGLFESRRYELNPWMNWNSVISVMESSAQHCKGTRLSKRIMKAARRIEDRKLTLSELNLTIACLETAIAKLEKWDDGHPFTKLELVIVREELKGMLW